MSPAMRPQIQTLQHLQTPARSLYLRKHLQPSLGLQLRPQPLSTSLRLLTALPSTSPSGRRHTHTHTHISTTTKRTVSTAPLPQPEDFLGSPAPTTPPPISQAPLSRLPTSTVLRSYLITAVSSSPPLLSLTFHTLTKLLSAKSAVFSITRNPILNKILKSTFYAQFCAGETPHEIKANTETARRVMGYDGIILEYALEVLEGAPPASEEECRKEVLAWEKGMLECIDMASPGDFIGLKWSGLGRLALHRLRNRQPPTPEMSRALHNACTLAAAKHISLLPGAEEEATNPGLEAWNLALQRTYNTPQYGNYAVVYTTYQCYLKAIPGRLAQHLEAAAKGGWVAGVKLVRGAYLTSEPRNMIWEDKEGTDKCYDNCAEAVLKRQWNDTVKAPNPDTSFPDVNIVLATHNAQSLQRAQAIRSQQLLSSPPTSLPHLTYAQLQGMADEISQSLVADPGRKMDTQSKVVKCMALGTVEECLNFLIRRAVENKEAAGRTAETRKAMGKELGRRLRELVGFA